MRQEQRLLGTQPHTVPTRGAGQAGPPVQTANLGSGPIRSGAGRKRGCGSLACLLARPPRCPLRPSLQEGMPVNLPALGPRPQGPSPAAPAGDEGER